jgi:hypothetical protein
VLLVEDHGLVGGVDLEPQVVLAPEGDLADHQRPEGAGVGLEEHGDRVLPRDARARLGAGRAPEGQARADRALGEHRRGARRDPRDAVAGDELLLTPARRV